MGGSLTGRRIAIYARHSSEKQNEASAADQITRCRAYIEMHGGMVDSKYLFCDEAQSGAVLQRPGYQKLLQLIGDGAVDIVVVESLSRLTRDDEDAAALRKRGQFAGVRILGLDGTDTSRRGSRLEYSVKSAMAAAYLEDLADQTHRGQKAKAEAGRVTGALPFGFRSVPASDGSGKVPRIDDDRAQVVQRIFTLFADGKSMAAIAKLLNAEGVRPPSKKRSTWMQSTIRAMLRNSRYRGLWAWNTHRWVRDPDTRKRVRRERPKAEHVSSDRPRRALGTRASSIRAQQGDVWRKCSSEEEVPDEWTRTLWSLWRLDARSWRLA